MCVYVCLYVCVYLCVYMFVCVYTSAVNELEQFEQVSNSIELLILRTLKKISVSNFTNFGLLNFELRTLLLQTFYTIIELAIICLII